MSALVGSGTGREGVNYSKVKVDDLTLHVPDYLDFKEDSMEIQKVQARGKTFFIVNNWTKK